MRKHGAVARERRIFVAKTIVISMFVARNVRIRWAPKRDGIVATLKRYERVK